MFALIFILALILSGWLFEDACPYVMGSRSEHNWISKYLLSRALPKGSQEEEDAGTEALQCCHLASWPSWLDLLASDCIFSAVGYHF